MICRYKYLIIYCVLTTSLNSKNSMKKFHLEVVYNPAGKEWRFTYKLMSVMVSNKKKTKIIISSLHRNKTREGPRTLAHMQIYSSGDLINGEWDMFSTSTTKAPPDSPKLWGSVEDGHLTGSLPPATQLEEAASWLCRMLAWTLLPSLLFLLSTFCLPKEDPNCPVSPPSLTCHSHSR